jgi:leader peptidase (prepilin peptidase) / N-methyltransferase
MDETIIWAGAFLFGLCIGSFLNVCIYRLPAGKSVIRPGSMCPSCGAPVRAGDNIPVLGYIRLMGKCRDCRAKIAIRYPLVEFITALFALSTVIRFGPSHQAILYFAFISVLLAITFIDIDHRIIPDHLTLPGIPLAFLASFALPEISLIDSLLGILAGGGTLYAVAWGYMRLTRKEGMGGGDIKLLAMIGAFIGWKGVLFTVFAASLVGSIAGLIVMLRTRGDMKLAVPFGPFLSVGAIVYIFFGAELISWYFGLLAP